MKSLKITTAAFSPAGNAYFKDKNKVDSYFCPKALLEAKDWKKATDIPFPIYVNVGTFTFNNMSEADDKGVREIILNADGTPSTFTRVDVIDAFLTAQALADDFADDQSLDILKEQAVKAIRIKAGLSSADVQALVDAL